MNPLRTAVPLLLALSTGCVVDLQGECTAPEDCPDGTSCVDGLCLSTEFAIDAGLVPAPVVDAGTVSGSIRITSPTTDALVGGGDLLVELEAEASEPISLVRLSVRAQGGTPQTFDLTTTTPGRYAASLPLGGPGYTSGTYILDASMVARGTALAASPVRFVLDRDPPQVTLTVRYPARSPGHLATGAFLRNETVVVEATITDAPSGTAAISPVLRTPGLADVVGTGALDTFRFEFPARAPAFAKLSGTVDVTVTATDAVGNTGNATTEVAITRRLWSWTKPRALPVSAAPALSGDTLVLGDETGHVYAIDRHEPPASGTIAGPDAWEFDVGGAPAGHVAIGATRTYIATRTGHVHALELAPVVTQRRAWTCPPLTPEFGFVDGLPLTPAGGPAILTTTVTDGSGSEREEETVVVLTRNRTLRAHRGTRFTSEFLGQPVEGCTKELSLGLGQPITTGTPAIDASGDIYAGTANGFVTRNRLARDANGTYAFTSVWGNLPFNAGAALAGPLAIATAGNNRVTSLFATTVEGGLFAFDTNAASIWSARVFSGALRGGAVANDSFAAAVDQPGNGPGGVGTARRLALTSGQVLGNPITLPERSDVADASPLIGSDGRTYVASGPRLSSLASDGSVEWFFDTRPSASGPASSNVDTVTPQLSCDGVLYVVASTTTASEVHALVTDSPGIATTGWPRAFHDPRNTARAGQPICP